MAPIITTEHLRKVFPPKRRGEKEVEAVRDISFTVEQGEIFGLLGPNGAGKTTTMRMLSTLLTPSGGTAVVTGKNLMDQSADIRTQIGYVSQVGGMVREATGRENLMLQARLYGMTVHDAEIRVADLLSLLQIEAFADRRTSTYSGGQRRIFDLASGIIHRPKLLFLDEPSTGLDPQNRAHVWEQVDKLRKDGTSVFLTTHYLDEADALCDRVAIVDHGAIVALGTPAALKQQIAGDSIQLSFPSAGEVTRAKEALVAISFIKEVRAGETTLQLYVEKGDEALPQLMRALHDRSIHIHTVELSRPTLDDVFLKLTGRTLRETKE